MTDVLMPRLSDSMEEGTILTWLAADGDDVAAGQELVEIETDKATMAYAAEADGVLSIVVAEGTTVAVGETIARLEAAGMRASAPATSGDGDAGADDVGADARADDGETDDEAAPGRIDEPAPVSVAAGSPRDNGYTTDEAGNGSTATAVPATPMARRIADAHRIDLGSLTGSGPRGRVLRADVMAAAGLQEQPAAPPAPASPSASPSAPAPAAPANGAAGNRGAGERVQLTRLQRLVARRMAEAKATIPEFQVQTEVEMTAAVSFRAELRALASSQGVPVPSLNDLIVKASALCLRRHPRANGSYVDDGFELHDRVNVGIAVAAQDALVVPVIRDADVRTLGQIAAESRRLAEAVRDVTVTPAELSGATFTVSNLGMYGMTAITPVINPPQAAILGVGAIREVLARGDDGAIVDRKLLTLTLSCDHRILYGADASQFLAAIRAVLEAPLGLAL